MTIPLMIIFGVAVCAGFIDAIAGGGGLILVPTLLFLGLTPSAAIATNKLFNVASSLTSAMRFWRSGTIHWHHFAWMIAPALFGSVLGSYLIGKLSRAAAEPVVAGLLIVVALIVLFRRNLGEEGQSEGVPKPLSRLEATKLGLAGFFIGVHDGFFGPGAGIFLIFTLVHFGRSTFLGATSTSKAINVLTSAIALTMFIRSGQVNWPYAVAGGAGVVLGSYAGARHVGAQGAKHIRPVFLCIAVAITVKIVASL